MRIRNALLSSLLGVILAAATSARAAGAEACKPDVEKFCKGIPAGGGRIASCLKSHEAELSQPCKDQLAAAKERMKEFAEACKPDAKKFCKGIPAGQGRILSCLKSHESELTPACMAQMTR
jgi:gas vesicle protein